MEQNNNKTTNAPHSNNTKHLFIAGIAIIVVIALAIAIPYFKKSTVSAPTVASTVTPVAAATVPSTAAQIQASLNAWYALYQKYDGRLVVFADNCSATPSTQIQKKDTVILLMNNSNTPHTVIVGSNVYAIGAYHYRTATLTTIGTTVINCDAHTSVATVTVQA